LCWSRICGEGSVRGWGAQGHDAFQAALSSVRKYFADLCMLEGEVAL